MTEDTQRTKLGNVAPVVFVSVNTKPVEGKVDTGATTSSIDASNVSVSGTDVSFVSTCFGTNTITLPLCGMQEVSSADGGTVKRPVVALSVSVAGVHIDDCQFNLSDRSNMDSPLLIGQNILQAGKFLVDPVVDGVKESVEQAPNDLEDAKYKKIMEAIEFLSQNDVTLSQIVKMLKTIAVGEK